MLFSCWTAFMDVVVAVVTTFLFRNRETTYSFIRAIHNFELIIDGAFSDFIVLGIGAADAPDLGRRFGKHLVIADSYDSADASGCGACHELGLIDCLCQPLDNLSVSP